MALWSRVWPLIRSAKSSLLNISGIGFAERRPFLGGGNALDPYRARCSRCHGRFRANADSVAVMMRPNGSHLERRPSSVDDHSSDFLICCVRNFRRAQASSVWFLFDLLDLLRRRPFRDSQTFQRVNPAGNPGPIFKHITISNHIATLAARFLAVNGVRSSKKFCPRICVP